MRTLERVRIDDVFPYVDEYGNAVLQRDYSTKENRAYLEDLKRSMRASGEPEEPPVLVRDGGIYVIRSGNSRVMAMRELGTKSFLAVVVDDEGEGLEALAREAVETTVRTNTKKRYSDEEESSYVQQLMLFASDDYVSRASGVDLATVRAARRGRARVGDEAEQMSLGRLAAIEELSDDERAVRALTECDESRWASVAEAERLRVARERRAAEVRRALGEAGVPVVAQRPLGAAFVAHVSDPSRVPADGADCAVCDEWGCTLYHVPDEAESARRDAEAAERAERAEARERSKAADAERARAARERRRSWVAGRLANLAPGGLPHLRGLALEAVSDALDADDALAMVAEAGAEPTVGGTLCVAWAYLEAEAELGRHGIWSYGYDGVADRHADGYWSGQLVRLLEAMTSDGYMPSEEEMRDYEEAQEVLGEEQQ